MYIHVHVLPRGHRSSPHKIGQYRRGSGYTPAHQRKAKLQYYVGAVSQVPAGIRLAVFTHGDAVFGN